MSLSRPKVLRTPLQAPFPDGFAERSVAGAEV
jgi:hypothetical protein